MAGLTGKAFAVFPFSGMSAGADGVVGWMPGFEKVCAKTRC